jgi:multisubunit Na+/H+ antiporter MnhE subunit
VTRTVSIGQAIALTSWFVLLWVMLWADLSAALSAANIVSGVLVAAVVVALSARFAAPAAGGRVRVSPIGLIVFVLHVVWSLVKSNLFLAWEIVTPINTIATGNVDVPLRSTSPAVAMAVSNVVTLTPGTVTVGIADDSSSLTIGVLHLDDPDEVVRDVRRTEELAIRAFGTPATRAALKESR